MRATLEWRKAAHASMPQEGPLIRPSGTFSHEGRRGARWMGERRVRNIPHPRSRHSSTALMAFSPQIAPLERFALRDGSKPLIRPSGTFSREGRRGRGGWGDVVPHNHPLPSSPIKGEVPPRWLGHPHAPPASLPGLSRQSIPPLVLNSPWITGTGPVMTMGRNVAHHDATASPLKRSARGAPTLSRAAGGRFGEGGRWNRCCAGRYWRRRARRKAPW